MIVFSPGQPIRAEPEISGLQSAIQLDGPWEFELQPTLDNRFGDFHWPPTPSKIGAEVRQLWYCEGDHTNGPWRKVTCSFGPQFIADGKPYEFSWRWGIENDPGHQGYHGLKAQVQDEFLAIGQPKEGPIHMPTVVSYSGSGGTFATAVIAPRDLTARALTGSLKPSRTMLNGEVVTGAELRLRAGTNPLVLQYEQPGRAYFVVSTEEIGPAPEGVLASRWWNHPAVLPFDVRAQEQSPVGWYRFVAPPGLRALTMKARGQVQVWIDGQPLIGHALPQPARGPVTVWLRIEQERGCYGGAAFLEPILLDCGPGQMALGDWSANDGLLSYSGGAWYRKTVTIPPAASVILDLGKVVASAEVRVNGRPAGVRVSPPWRFDITALVKPGENRIAVLVCNTLANHYTTVPTRYRGDTTSGLLGPVTLQFSEGQ